MFFVRPFRAFTGRPYSYPTVTVNRPRPAIPHSASSSATLPCHFRVTVTYCAWTPSRGQGLCRRHARLYHQELPIRRLYLSRVAALLAILVANVCPAYSAYPIYDLLKEAPKVTSKNPFSSEKTPGTRGAMLSFLSLRMASFSEELPVRDRSRRSLTLLNRDQ